MKKKTSIKACNESLVIQSNNLINARHKLTFAEKRIMLFMISKINLHDTEFKKYRINIKDFVKNIKTKHKGEHERAKEITKKMLSRVLQIPESNGLLQVTLLSSVRYYDGEGYIDICFDPELKPYLLQLKERFTAYNIKNILSLQSCYVINIYEFLKQYENIGHRTFHIEELKEILGLQDKYKLYGHFKNRIILPAQKELKEHCDLFFEFEEIKEGRKITTLKFFIKTKTKEEKPKQLPNPKPGAEIDISNLNQDLIEQLVDIGLKRIEAIKYVKTEDNETVKDYLDYTNELHKIGKIEFSKAAYIKGLFKKQAVVRSPEEKRKQKEAEEAVRQKEKQKKEHEEIFAYKRSFEEMINVKTDELVQKATEEDKQAFKDSLSESDKSLGHSAKIMESWFRVYLRQQNGIDNSAEAFKEYMLKEHGLTVKKVSIRCQDTWVYVEKQESFL